MEKEISADAPALVQTLELYTIHEPESDIRYKLHNHITEQYKLLPLPRRLFFGPFCGMSAFQNEEV